MTSLSEKLAQLANPAPILQDPEDEANFDTVARVVDKYEEHEDGAETSHLRKQLAPLLSETDSRYSGKKVSRDDLRDGSSASESDESNESESDDEKDIEDFRAKIRAETLAESSGDDVIVEEECIEEKSIGDDESENEDSSYGSEDDDFEEASIDEKENVVQQFSNFDLNEEIEKGKAVKAQLALWDSLLECRIKMQKVLIAANKLPQHDTWSEFVELGDQEYRDDLKTSEKAVKMLLDKFIGMQKTLLESNPEVTSHSGDVGEQSLEAKMSYSDEEITSESESEVSAKRNNRTKRRKYDNEDYPIILQKVHDEFAGYRNATIQKWNEKTRLGSGKLNHKSFSAFEQSALKQIEQILSDKDRLHRRTQLKRTVYRVLGKCEEQGDVQIDGTEETDLLSKQVDQTKEYDVEIFDDDDFYHQLLRELIERKTADVNDPVALSRQWLEIQRLRSKMKRKVDTKASKGRKIRFDVHPKLVNFMAPVIYCETTDDAKNELFSSLFGKKS